MKLMPQLAFNGQCRQAFEYYERLLGGKITVMNTFGGPADATLPPDCKSAEAGQVRFAELQVGAWAILGNDVPAESFQAMRGFNIALHTPTVAEARRVFDALANGGRITVPLSEVAWSPCFGLVTDRFGVPWLILALDR
jgi:PhnB protein